MDTSDTILNRARKSNAAIRFATHAVPAVLFIIMSVGCGQSTDRVGEADEGRLVLGSTEEREVLERGVAPGGRELVFEGFHGNIRLEATPDRFAALEFVKIARGDDGEGARRLLQGVTISEQGSDEEFRYVFDSPDKQRTAVDVRGSVPQATSMHIAWESGAISLSGPDGPLRITNGSGRVEAAGIAATAEIRVQNGGLMVGVVDLPSGASIVLETSNGDINLTLPAGTSAQIAAQTAAGEIQTTGLSFVDRRLEPIGAGAEFNAQLGRGNATIRLRTENGAIHLMEGRMDRLQPPDTLAVPADTAASAPEDAAASVPLDTASFAPSDTTVRDARRSVDG